MENTDNIMVIPIFSRTPVDIMALEDAAFFRAIVTKVFPTVAPSFLKGGGGIALGTSA